MLITFIILFIALFFIFKSSNKLKVYFSFVKPPVIISEPIVEEIEKSVSSILSKTYIENIEIRLQSEHHHFAENEFNWRALELKRFFILCAILKKTPMFSEKVDLLWHEMIMFTKEYNDFSHRFIGTFLHHQPNMKNESDPDLRGFFDWIYSNCFTIYKESIFLYNGFFRHPVSKKVIDDFTKLEIGELKKKYFRTDSKYEHIIESIILNMKKQAQSILVLTTTDAASLRANAISNKKMHELLLPALVFSYFEYDNYSSFMLKTSDTSSSASSCSFCSSCSNCSSCSGSGCSSCSSCGGGGD